jgi:hypothetical protein
MRAEDRADVVPAEGEGIRHCDLNGLRHGVAAQMVEIALAVRLIQVPRRRQLPAR